MEAYGDWRTPPPRLELMNLPDIELVAAKVHASWMANKRASGVTSRKLEGGEELMVPYEQLSEQAKDLDRATVRTYMKRCGRLHPLDATVCSPLRKTPSNIEHRILKVDARLNPGLPEVDF